MSEALGHYTGRDCSKGQPGVPFEIKAGDRVHIGVSARPEKHVRGWDGEGVVLTACHCGRQGGWYIEFTVDTELGRKCSTPRYGYWKQGVDGGSVVVLERR